MALKQQTKIDVNEINKDVTKTVFVNRTEAIDKFINNINELKNHLMDEEGFCACTYYWGVGGIGKSTLIDYILRSSENPWGDEPILNDDQIRVKYNLYTSYNQIEILYSIKKKIIEEVKNKTGYDVDFILFDLAVAFFNKKTDANYNYSNDNNSSEKESSILKEIFNLTCEFVKTPFKELFDKVEKGYEGIKLIVDKVNEKRIKEQYEILLERIKKESKSQILVDMIDCFLLDLERCINKLKETHIEALPIIISVDTLENMEEVEDVNVNKEEYYIDWLLNKEWGMIKKSRDIYWLLSGRNELKDTIVDADEHYEILGLQEQYIKEILRKKGIVKKDIVKNIVEVTEGLPAYIDVCTELYERKKDKVTKEDFEGDITKIVNRFLQNMDDKDKENLYLMSSLGIWTDKDYIKIADKSTGYINLEINYNELVRKSFISIDNEYRKIFHNVVRQAIYSDSSFTSYRKNTILQDAVDYYLERLDSNISIEDKYYYADRIIFTIDELVSNEEQFNLIYDCLQKHLLKHVSFSIITQVYNSMCNCALKYSDKERQIRVLKIAIHLNNDSALLIQASEKQKKLCDIFTEIYGKNHYETLQSKYDLAEFYRRTNNKEMEKQLINEIYKDCKDIHGTTDISKIICLLSDIMSYYKESNNYDVVIELLENILSLYDVNNLFKEHLDRYIKESILLINLYIKASEFEKAEQNINKLEELVKCYWDKEYIIYIPKILLLLGKNEDIITVTKRVSREYEEIKQEKGIANISTLDKLKELIIWSMLSGNFAGLAMVTQAKEWFKDNDYGKYVSYNDFISRISFDCKHLYLFFDCNLYSIFARKEIENLYNIKLDRLYQIAEAPIEVKEEISAYDNLGLNEKINYLKRIDTANSIKILLEIVKNTQELSIGEKINILEGIYTDESKKVLWEIVNNTQELNIKEKVIILKNIRTDESKKTLLEIVNNTQELSVEEKINILKGIYTDESKKVLWEIVNNTQELDLYIKIDALKHINTYESKKILFDIYNNQYGLLINNGREESLDSIRLLKEIANHHERYGNYGVALEIYKYLYEHHKETSGASNYSAIDTLHSITDLYELIGDNDNYISALQSIYELNLNGLGEKNEITIYSLFDLARGYYKINEIEKSIEFLEKVATSDNEDLKERALECIKKINNQEEVFPELVIKRKVKR